MASDHAGIVLRFDHAAAGDGYFAGPGIDPDKRYRVVILIIIFEFEMRIFIAHFPIQYLLPLRFLGRKPQTLQRMHHRGRKSVACGMTDREFH